MFVHIHAGRQKVERSTKYIDCLFAWQNVMPPWHKWATIDFRCNVLWSKMLTRHSKRWTPGGVLQLLCFFVPRPFRGQESSFFTDRQEGSSKVGKFFFCLFVGRPESVLETWSGLLLVLFAGVQPDKWSFTSGTHCTGSNPFLFYFLINKPWRAHNYWSQHTPIWLVGVCPCVRACARMRVSVLACVQTSFTCCFTNRKELASNNQHRV